MEQWGVPKRIKIDNGFPLANAEYRKIPTLTQLWWIGLGIEVQLNAVRVPQQNGAVENLQGTGCRWSAPHQYQDLESYQKRVNETARFQREVFRIRKEKDQTRKQLYPELWENPRLFDKSKFSMKLIYDNLELRVWNRKVNKAGRITFWNQKIYIGKAFIRRKVNITFDPLKTTWLVRASDGTILKEHLNNAFSEKRILQHVDILKNFD